MGISKTGPNINYMERWGGGSVRLIE